MYAPLIDMFPSNIAYTITRLYKPFENAYPIKDVEIIAANGAAAAIYGYATPDDLVGCMLSDTQSIAERHQGRCSFEIRRMGHPVPMEYYATVERPDGETIAVRKEAVETSLVSRQENVWVTRLEPVQWAWQDPPDLAQFGVSEPALRAQLGWTIREASRVEVQMNLQCTDNIRTLLSDHQDLLSSVHGRLFTWSKPTDGKMHDRISQLHCCVNCGWCWYGKLGLRVPQCSQCRQQPGRTRTTYAPKT